MAPSQALQPVSKTLKVRAESEASFEGGLGAIPPREKKKNIKRKKKEKKEKKRKKKEGNYEASNYYI